nr:integrase, catalytic region, zinc finger, CCHC-type, peptidase aspartic, catalytic [Tanacetum cinerariifolium]
MMTGEIYIYGEGKVRKSKVVLHLLDNPSSHPLVNEKSSLDATTCHSDVLPDLGSFGNVFDLPDGGAIDGNTVMNELFLNQARQVHTRTTKYKSRLSKDLKP